MKLPPFRFNHVVISLFIAFLYLIFVPHVPVFQQYAVMMTVGTLLLLALIARRANAWVDVMIALILALSFLCAHLWFRAVDDASLVFRTAAILAFIFLHFTLFIGPWSRFTPEFLHIYKHRRHFGVTSFLLALVHSSFIIDLYFKFSIRDAFQAVFIFFGFTASFIMFLLAATSWDYVQKHVSLKWWKWIHAFTFLIYAGFVVYFFTVAQGLIQPWQKVLLALFLIFWFLVAPWSLSKKILRRVNGWKQLHVLIYIGYVSVLAHVWTGTAKQQGPWIQALFWTFVVGLVSSHAWGWIIMFKQWRARKRVPQAVVELKGSVYHFLDRVENFREGVGRLFDIQGFPLATYFHDGRFFTMSNICPHQGGPISQGEIVSGYVECPWHHYQFSVKDGMGPPGFVDCVPYYDTQVQNGSVYVSLERVKNKDECGR